MKNMNSLSLRNIPPHPAFGHPLPQGARWITRGFTLIELLVVVLIIGVLTTVAVPQYREATMKSEYQSIMDIAQIVENAENMYYLANGSYTQKLSDLDVNFDTSKNKLYFWGNNINVGIHITMPSYPRIHYAIILYKGKRDRRECTVKGVAADWEKKFCHKMTGKTNGVQASDYYAYF